ncbi:MAG TPA: Ig-like domain-containing protein, partial [Pirellulaceae bacterium]|nr:Ig-like domain-containing protein [Pirellulaceae bacterium]
MQQSAIKGAQGRRKESFWQRLRLRERIAAWFKPRSAARATSPRTFGAIEQLEGRAVLAGDFVPVANNDAYAVITETSLTVDATSGVLANDTDADGDSLTASVSTEPSHGTVTLNSNGSFTYSPVTGFSGTDSFTYFANDGQNSSVPGTVTLTVIPPNRAPVAVADSYSGVGDQPLGVDAANGVLKNDTDADSDPLTAFVTTNPLHGEVTLNADGSFIYTPTPGFVGADSFQYKASDGLLDSTAQTVSLTLTAPNRAPTTTGDSYTTSGGITLTINAANGVLGNDSDPDGDALTATVVNTASNGTLTLNANGSFSYTPDVGFSGLDTFDYQASDGALPSAITTVSIIVTPTNSPPSVENDSYAATTGQSLTISATIGVLANDSDADSDSLTAAVTQQPSHGTVTLSSDGGFTYTPASGFTGQDSFQYVANDGTVDSDPATVTLTVASGNHAPVAAADGYTTSSGQSLIVGTSSGVLSNDTDADNNTLTAAIVTTPSHGTVTLNTNGSFTYTPTNGFSGTDSFTYRANDGTADSSPATVTLTVTAANVAPVAVADSY